MENNISEFNENAELLKILAHPVRLCIVNGLIKNGGCNVSHMQNCLSMPQSTISQHLQKLRTAGIIEGERNGLEVSYRICNDKVKKIMKVLFE